MIKIQWNEESKQATCSTGQSHVIQINLPSLEFTLDIGNHAEYPGDAVMLLSGNGVEKTLNFSDCNQGGKLRFRFDKVRPGKSYSLYIKSAGSTNALFSDENLDEFFLGTKNAQEHVTPLDVEFFQLESNESEEESDGVELGVLVTDGDSLYLFEPKDMFA